MGERADDPDFTLLDDLELIDVEDLDQGLIPGHSLQRHRRQPADRRINLQVDLGKPADRLEHLRELGISETEADRLAAIGLRFVAATEALGEGHTPARCYFFDIDKE